MRTMRRSVLWFVLAVVLYVLSCSPITRYFPVFAFTFYRPLSPLETNPYTRDIVHAYLRFWGLPMEMP